MAKHDEDRQAALQSYIQACVAQHLVSLDDLRNPLLLLPKLGRTMLDDLKAVGKVLLSGAGSVASVKAAEGFMELADRLGKRQRR